MRANMSLYIRGNEGGTDATTAYDSILDNDAVFAAPPNSPSFQNGLLHFGSDTARAIITNHSSIDTLSVFTIACKVRLDMKAQTAAGDYILTKGVSGNGEAANTASLSRIES